MNNILWRIYRLYQGQSAISICNAEKIALSASRMLDSWDSKFCCNGNACEIIISNKNTFPRRKNWFETIIYRQLWHYFGMKNDRRSCSTLEKEDYWQNELLAEYFAIAMMASRIGCKLSNKPEFKKIFGQLDEERRLLTRRLIALQCSDILVGFLVQFKVDQHNRLWKLLDDVKLYSKKIAVRRME